MGLSRNEYINSKKYYTLEINAGKCKTSNMVWNEFAECLILPTDLDKYSYDHLIDEEIYSLINSGNIKFIIEKSNVLLNKNKKIYDFLLELLENYEAYAKDVGHDCIIEFK